MSKDAKTEVTNTSHAPATNWQSLAPFLETLLVVIVIAFVQYKANAMMEERARYTLMLIGTCYGTWRGGKGPGVFALLLSGLIGAFFLTGQHFSLVVQDILDSVSLTLYLIVGAVIVIFGESQRRERRLVQEREEELKSAHAELAKANSALEALLQKRQNELSEIKRFVAEEELHTHSNVRHHGYNMFEPRDSDEVSVTEEP